MSMKTPTPRERVIDELSGGNKLTFNQLAKRINLPQKKITTAVRELNWDGEIAETGDWKWYLVKPRE